jgi:hypothetical protein
MARERDIQKLILDWLAAKKIWHIRLNTGAMGGSHNGKRWFVRFGKPGMADILAVTSVVETVDDYTMFPKPVVAWIEVKAEKGKQSDDQKRFQEEVEREGMTYILARSLEDVTEIL